MDDLVAVASRAAAGRLAPELGPGVGVDVDEALLSRVGVPTAEQYLDPISLGSLIVSAATLAWTIYKDLRDKKAAPAPSVLARRVRVQLETSASTDSAQRGHIIDVVVSEVIAAAEVRADD